MKVLLDARMGVGGVERYANDLIKSLPKVDPELELEVIEPEQRFSHRPFTPWSRARIGRMATEMSVDLVHGLHFELPSSSVPGVVTMPDAIPLEHPASMPNPFARAYFARVIRRSAAGSVTVVTPSHLGARELVRHGVPASKIEVIPLGLDPLFRPASGEERELARHRFSKGSRYVAVVAEDRPHKNLGVLPRVATGIPTGIHLLCRGRSSKRLPTISFVERLSDADLRLFYAGAEALLLPSLVEGFGLPALEAAGCGTPVVCGRGVGAVEFLGDAVTVVDVTDVDAIIDRLRAVLSDPALRDSLVAAGAARANELSIERMAKSTSEVYRAARS
ncbi:MAG: hypothetical protein QOK47_1698 [Actinomycetota bacterium]|nr:hypothetical protein [Actinomycetota bacterium]